jgi:hypothetical protein
MAKKDSISIRELKVTTNANLLIFPNEINDAEKIMKSDSFLPGLKKIDLQNENKKHFLMVKGVKASELISELNNCKTNFRIKIVHQIANQDGRVLNMCKLEFDNLEDKEKLSNDGFIQPGFFKYNVENMLRAPLRCHNCKQFGHSTLKCSAKERCANCGCEHNTLNCNSINKTCLNCGENHSSYYKGCRMYKEQVKIEAERSKTKTYQNKKENNNTSQAPAGFIRKYSEAGKNDSVNSIQIDSKLTTFLKEIQTNISSQLSEFTKEIKTNMIAMKNELELSFSKLIYENNVKLCKFFVDLIKIMIPTCKKPSEKISQSISNHFNNHKLGSVSSKIFIEQTKAWIE